MNSSSNSTSFTFKSKMEGMVVGSGPTAYMCNLPIKKKEKKKKKKMEA